MPYSYITDGAEIYRQSFATIRAEAALARFTPEEEVVTVRMIHAAGMVGLEKHIDFTPGAAIAARAALEGGAPILCDVRMVSEGITRPRLPASNPIICTLPVPPWPSKWAIHGRQPQWSYGGPIWRAQSLSSAMPPPRCSICSTCWKTLPARAPPPSSAALSALSAQQKARTR